MSSISDPKLCIICKKKPGTGIITDAKQYPEIYNGKPICTGCHYDREMLKNDTPSEGIE